MSRILVILVLFVSAAVSNKVAAQEETYRFDIGGQVGVAGYLGDASSSIFSKPGFSGGVSFRYLPDVRWAVRGVMCCQAGRNIHSNLQPMTWAEG